MTHKLMQITLEFAFPWANWQYTGPMFRTKTMPLVMMSASPMMTADPWFVEVKDREKGGGAYGGVHLPRSE